MRFEYTAGAWRYIGTVEETADGIPHEMDQEEYDEAEELFLLEYRRQK